MSKRRNSFDRSTMFTCLLHLSPAYGEMEARKGEQVVTDALEAWYADDESTNMYAFTRSWLRTARKDLPLR